MSDLFLLTVIKKAKLFLRTYKFISSLVNKSIVSLLDEKLKDINTILDVGCGQCSPLRQLTNKPIYKVGVDIYEPYIEKSKLLYIHDYHVLGDARNLPFKTKSFECTMAIEVIEHLTKFEGLKMIKEMERIAKKRVILTTPNGLLLVKPGPEDNPEERHISGWTAKGLRKLGFKVYGINGWKVLRGERAALKFRPRWLFTKLSVMTNPLAYHYPSIAFQLFCFKDIEDH